MKCEAKQINPPPAFPPVELKLTFESEDEISAFYAVLNYSPICDFLRKHSVSADALRTALENAFPTISINTMWPELTDGLGRK